MVRCTSRQAAAAMERPGMSPAAAARSGVHRPDVFIPAVGARVPVGATQWSGRSTAAIIAGSLPYPSYHIAGVLGRACSQRAAARELGRLRTPTYVTAGMPTSGTRPVPLADVAMLAGAELLLGEANLRARDHLTLL